MMLASLGSAPLACWQSREAAEEQLERYLAETSCVQSYPESLACSKSAYAIVKDVESVPGKVCWISEFRGTSSRIDFKLVAAIGAGVLLMLLMGGER